MYINLSSIVLSLKIHALNPVFIQASYSILPCEMEDKRTGMGIEYTWILCQGKNCRQFRLLTWTSFISQYDQLVGGWDGVKGDDGVDRYFSQIQVSLHANLV